MMVVKQKTTQPVESDEELVNQFSSTSRVSLFQNACSTGQGWTSTGREAIEVQRLLVMHSMLTASQLVKTLTTSLTLFFLSIKRFQSSLFKELNILKHFFNIFEHWESVF